MTDLLILLLVASLAAVPLYLMGRLAERVDVPRRVIAAALQVAAGMIIAIVAFALMPNAVQNGPLPLVVLAFFLGGLGFVAMDYLAARGDASDTPGAVAQQAIGIFVGVLVDMAVDGVAIGIGLTIATVTGVILAIGLAIGTAPLAFITIATAKQQGVSPARRHQLSLLFAATTLAGALIGFFVFREQPDAVKLVLLAFAAGFLVTMITQTMIPEALSNDDKRTSGIFFVIGLTVFAALSLAGR